MQKFSKISALSLLAVALSTSAQAQLRSGEAPTQQQVATGEVPQTPIFEGETAIRSLQNPMGAPEWPVSVARELLDYVEGVGEEGLDPADYGVERLRAAIASANPQELRTAATDTFLRLSSDLALGHVRGDDRIDWHVIDHDLDGNQQYAMMRSAVQNGTVRDTLTSLLPTHPQYIELKGVLASAQDEATRAKVRTNLDRWRWLPRDLGKRYVIVNVPAYTVALVEDGRVVTRHRAVVGTTKTPTPQLSATATGVILNPWWEIPKSIEPEVRGKKGYVRVKNGDGFRYRQPPGPRNALGRMKVVMPNNYAIYLHDTPSKALFKRDERAFSHGCIRTQDALGFARQLLGNPEWDQAAIDAALASGKTIEAKATVATPVYITYFTAAAAKDNGGIIAYDDIYGRDAKVVAALADTGNQALASAAN